MGRRERQGVATVGALTRSDVAAALGVHVSSVRRYERAGLLNPRGEDGEERLFDPSEVEALARRRSSTAARKPASPGQAAARVFALFRKGVSHEEIVTSLEMDPGIVRALFLEWRAGYRIIPVGKSTVLVTNDDGASGDRDTRQWERQMTTLLKQLSEEDLGERRKIKHATPHRRAPWTRY